MKKLAIIAFVFLSQTTFAQFDTLKFTLPIDTLTSLTHKLDSIEISAKNKIDSVTQYYQKATGKIQNLTSGYQHKIDSLTHLRLPTEKYTKKLDSLSNKLVETKQQVEGKIQSIKQKATEKINSLPLPPELQTKVAKLTTSLDKLNLDALTSKNNSPIDLNGINTSLDQIIPSTDLKNISDLSVDLPSVDIPDVGKNLGSVSNLMSGVSEQASALQNSTNEITQGISQANNLDKRLKAKSQN